MLVMKKSLILAALFLPLFPLGPSADAAVPASPYYSGVLPGGWSISFFGPQLGDSMDKVVFLREGREAASFKLPSGNSLNKIIVDEPSGRVVIGIQTDNATFVLKMCDLKTGKAADIDMSVLLGRLAEDFPEAAPDDYVGHSVVQCGALKLEDGKVMGTAVKSGTVGDLRYDLTVPFSINIAQPWPEAGRKAVMTLEESSMERTPDPDPVGKTPRMQ